MRATSSLTGDVQLCGFGPISAAATAAKLLSANAYTNVTLIGIAGTFDDRVLPVGAACAFSSVAIDGIGVGEGETFRSAKQIGFQIRDSIDLQGFDGSDSESRALLTVCAASANAEQASRRKARFQSAIAEDMEGFGVAVACESAAVPLRIVRGISNRVGDRDHGNWQIEKALLAACSFLDRTKS